MDSKSLMDDVVAVHINKCPRALWQWAKSLAALGNQSLTAFFVAAVEAQCIREAQAREQARRQPRHEADGAPNSTGREQ